MIATNFSELHTLTITTTQCKTQNGQNWIFGFWRNLTEFSYYQGIREKSFETQHTLKNDQTPKNIKQLQQTITMKHQYT